MLAGRDNQPIAAVIGNADIDWSIQNGVCCSFVDTNRQRVLVLFDSPGDPRVFAAKFAQRDLQRRPLRDRPERRGRAQGNPRCRRNLRPACLIPVRASVVAVAESTAGGRFRRCPSFGRRIRLTARTGARRGESARGRRSRRHPPAPPLPRPPSPMQQPLRSQPSPAEAMHDARLGPVRGEMQRASTHSHRWLCHSGGRRRCRTTPPSPRMFS
jgi:hypothetical protein